MAGAGDAAGASRARILAGGKNWKAVLGVAASACTEEVKKAYRKLVLIHHPDKPGGDVDTFRLVHQAYVLGLKKCRKTVVSKADAGGGAAAGPTAARCSPRKRRPPAEPVIPGWMRHCFKVPPAEPQAAPPASDDDDEDELPHVPAAKPRDVVVPSPEKGQAPGKVKAKARGKAKAKARTAQGRESPRAAAVARPGPPPAEVSSPTTALRRAAAAAAAAEADEAPLEPPSKRPARAKPWVLPEGATAARAKVVKALEAWENTAIEGARTRPDEIPEVEPSFLAQQLRGGACLAVDVRDGRTGVEIQGCEVLGFDQFFNSPENVLLRVAKLKEDTRQLVLFSDEGETLGTCGLVAAALLDVFGFDAGRLSRLRGGFSAWSRHLDANPAVARTVEPLSVRLARRRAAGAGYSIPVGPGKGAAPEPLLSFCTQTGGG